MKPKLETKLDKRGALALSQILILVVGIIAFSYALGSSVGFVSGSSSSSAKCKNCKGEVYTVKEGDTLSAIAVSRGTTVDDIIKASEEAGCLIKNRNLIGVGQQICIPKKGNLKEPIKDLTIGTTTSSEESAETTIYGIDTGTNTYIIEDTPEWWEDYVSGDYTPSQEELENVFLKDDDGSEISFWDVLNTIDKTERGINFYKKTKKGFEKMKNRIKLKPNDKIAHFFKETWLGRFCSGGTGGLSGWELAYQIAKALGASERNLMAINWKSEQGKLTILGSAIGGGLAALKWTILGSPFLMGLVVGLALTVIVAAISFQNYSRDIITYAVGLWQPPYGGENCEKCNELEHGCTEYQCHTFGRACELINKGTKYERCAWVGKDDRLPPILEPLEGVLPEGLKYVKSETTSPPERGVKVVKILDPENENECLTPFTSLIIGIKTNEYANCRWDYEDKGSYSEYAESFTQGSAMTINHTFYLPSSATASEEALENVGIAIEGGRNYAFFIKCVDRNGNENPLPFMIEFCVEEGPDLRPPKILGTSLDGAYIRYNATSLPIYVYTNEPATCKWDLQNRDYENMAYNFSHCSQNMEDYLQGTLSYGCNGTITGFKDRVENTYYIKCKDKPWLEGKEKEGDVSNKRIANRDPYILKLKGTEPLYIEYITINGKGSGAILKNPATEGVGLIHLEVKTIGGAENGKSKCLYRFKDNESIKEFGENWFTFYNEGSYQYKEKNTQTLTLGEGNYTLEILCLDKASNDDNQTINFTIEIDRSIPQIVRAYKENDFLKIITNEKAKCVYSITGCLYEFDDGETMTSLDGIEHSVAWDPEKTFYIKCKDEYENLPGISDCTMIVTPSKIGQNE